jgi:hypothetical protein
VSQVIVWPSSTHKIASCRSITQANLPRANVPLVAQILPFFIIYVPFLLMGTGISFLEVKRPGCEADHSLQSSTEVEYYCSYTSPPSYVTRILAYTEATLLQTTLTDYTLHTTHYTHSANISAIDRRGNWLGQHFSSSCKASLQESKFLENVCHLSFFPQFRSVVSRCLHVWHTNTNDSTAQTHFVSFYCNYLIQTFNFLLISVTDFRYVLSDNSKVKLGQWITIQAWY